jgi:hypothetical protein
MKKAGVKKKNDKLLNSYVGQRVLLRSSKPRTRFPRSFYISGRTPHSMRMQPKIAVEIVIGMKLWPQALRTRSRRRFNCLICAVSPENDIPVFDLGRVPVTGNN